jgi:hypothetical protein
MEVMPLPTPSKPDQPEMQRGPRGIPARGGVTSRNPLPAGPSHPRSVIIGFGLSPSRTWRSLASCQKANRAEPLGIRGRNAILVKISKAKPLGLTWK